MKYLIKILHITLFTTLLIGCSGISDGLEHKNSDDSGDASYSYSININNSSEYIYVRDATLIINSGDAVYMRFSNDDISWTEWEPVCEEKSWILTGMNSSKTVYAEFRKPDDQIVKVSDSIEFVEKIFSKNNNPDELFGISVDVSGDGNTVIAGGENSPYTSSLGFTYNPGTANIYVYDGIRWNISVLSLVGASDGDLYGKSVSLNDSGNIAFVGSPGYDGGRGRVLMFSYDSVSHSWQFIDEVVGDADSSLGNSVAVSGNGNILAVSAVTGNSRKGEVKVYSVAGTTGLTLLGSFSAGDGEAEDRFGCDVSISNDGSVIVVGAEQKKVGVYTNSGKIYVYRKVSSVYVSTSLQCSVSDYNIFFGCSVSISDDGDIVCSGARGDSSEKGLVYVFRYDSLSDVYTSYTISDSNGSMGDQFGYSVECSGDGSSIWIGSPYFDYIFNDAGKVSKYSFDGGSYYKEDEYLASESTYQKLLGYSTAISDSENVKVFGAIGDMLNSSDCGSCYIFRE